LKVKWNGTSVTEASAIGFWFEHKNYASGTSYTNYIVSVNQIEQWTGLDLFTNLPDGLEESAENNTTWSTFQQFVGQSESAFQ
jgi:endonuclease G